MNQPLVTVITPSYNQGKFIEETIESVLQQDYPFIEYIVIDGASTDNTLEILSKYTDRIKWISEPDQGQSNALNKGLSMAKGSIIGWLNSDDLYCPGAIKRVVETFQQHPDISGVYGPIKDIDTNGNVIGEYLSKNFQYSLLPHACFIAQPSCFMKKQMLIDVGGFDETLKHCMDYELWMRAGKNHKFLNITLPHLACNRNHTDTKTNKQFQTVGLFEIFRISFQHFRYLSKYWINKYYEFYPNTNLVNFMELLKKYGASPSMPSILSLDRYSDFWVSDHFTFRIKNTSQNPVKYIHLVGRVRPYLDNQTVSIFVNERFLTKINITGNHFEEVISLTEHPDLSELEFRLISDNNLVPTNYGIQDNRSLAFLLFNLLPYSDFEFEIYNHLKKKEKAIGNSKDSYKNSPKVASKDESKNNHKVMSNDEPNNNPKVMSKDISKDHHFLLIKSWESGFWCQMEHVSGELMVAELTGRIPVIYWGPDSFYSSDKPLEEDAFSMYFLPVSNYTINDLEKPNYTFYPSRWNHRNLRLPDTKKLENSEWVSSHRFSRTENVLVSSLHLRIINFEKLINKNHPIYGLEEHEKHRYIYKKYFKLQPFLKKEIENFYSKKMKNRHPILGVHVRGSDKIQEQPQLHQLNKTYFSKIDEYLKNNPTASIFLLTDSEQILAKYRKLYGEKLIYTDCIRTPDENVSTHYGLPKYNNKQKGIDVIKDTYLALKCDHFIGAGFSNVSLAIYRLKDWAKGTITLLP
ncbi:glycosyltransferase [Metabacillus sp. Hm71]|uniref:glycosyltransferase n=1 Tax=Metabacillus sp. Hm71 TaxID=3450743 RepID=UPI003F440151